MYNDFPKVPLVDEGRTWLWPIFLIPGLGFCPDLLNRVTEYAKLSGWDSACLLSSAELSDWVHWFWKEGGETFYSIYSLASKLQEWPSRMCTDDVSKASMHVGSQSAIDKWWEYMPVSDVSAFHDLIPNLLGIVMLMSHYGLQKSFWWSWLPWFILTLVFNNYFLNSHLFARHSLGPVYTTKKQVWHHGAHVLVRETGTKQQWTHAYVTWFQVI